jgi:hypothetical protein
VEKLLPVTDKSALRLGVSVGQFLGEAESNIEFEQVFGWGRDCCSLGPLRAQITSGGSTLECNFEQQRSL